MSQQCINDNYYVVNDDDEKEQNYADVGKQQGVVRDFE
jgi:hypothetical protein